MVLRVLARLASVLLASFLAPFAAQAELGGPMASIATDGDRIGARSVSVAADGYVRHDLTRMNNGMVHEFTNNSGQVFAVTWHGPGKPDLRLLLGPYFAALQGGGPAAGRAMHALRRPLQVRRPDLQIQTGGHMGWFHGIAFIPALAPVDFSPADLARQP